jgi:malate dehydrogenase
MAEAIIKDKKRIIPCAAYCEKEYGVGGYFVGVPAVLGAGGMEKIIEIKMAPDEKKLMDESISHVKDLVGIVRKTFPELA